MLVEAQLAAGAQHAPQLGERVRLVRHRAQDKAGDGRIKRRIVGGQLVGDPVDDLDMDLRLGGGCARASRRYGSGSTATTSSTVAG